MAAWVKDDGGRAAAGYTGEAGDCVTRAIAIASGRPYQEVYDALAARIAEYGATRRDRVAKRIARGKGLRGTTPRNGVSPKVYGPYLESLGFRWKATMGIGTGCKVHLRAEELPAGRIIARCSKHIVAVIDGVIRDNYDPSRAGTRCVYGYYYLPEESKGLLKAAPTLLQAAKEALASMEEAMLRDNPDAHMSMEWEAEPMAGLRAAISQAEGR